MVCVHVTCACTAPRTQPLLFFLHRDKTQWISGIIDIGYDDIRYPQQVHQRAHEASLKYDKIRGVSFTGGISDISDKYLKYRIYIGYLSLIHI